MSGLLCLKWNNHSPAILKNISNIHIKEKYCDATIVCQGTYFPVHKIILSTCSEYFDDMFDRMQCQHPYIVFKDIEPAEIELLLNYMYHGEVNVVQEMLPSLIKVAEALKIKGLAVPDDEIFKEDSCGKKRSINTDDGPHPEPKRMDEGRRKRNSVSANASTDSGDSNIYSNIDTVTNFQNLNKTVAEYITTESLRKEFENAALPMNDPLNSPANQGSSVADVPLVNDSASCSIKKEENPYVLDSYVDQVPPSDWSDFANGGAHNVSGTEANTPNTFSAGASCPCHHVPASSQEDSAESIDSELTEAEPQPPWPFLGQWVKYKKMVGDSYVFQCLSCLPKNTEVKVNKGTKANLKSHFNRIHPDEAKQIDEACKANAGTGGRRKNLFVQYRYR